MSDFYLKKSDILPAIRAHLSDSNGYVNLSGSNCFFIYKDMRATGSAVTGTATIVSAISGLVEYAWASGASPGVGTYYAEWRAGLPGGKQMSFPNDGHISFQIFDSLS